jgi:hypothetical protein
MVGDDMHPTGWHTLRQALRLERATRAVAPVGTIPLAGFRAVTGFEPLLRRTPDNVVMGIELESPGRKALRAPAARGAKGRNDRFDLASFKRGVYPPHAMDRVRRVIRSGGAPTVSSMASRRSSNRPVSCCSPVTISSCRRHACGVTSTTTPSWSSTAVCCLQVGRNGAFDDVAVASGFSNRWRNRWQLASGSVRQSFLNAPLVRASRSVLLAFSTASRWRATRASILTFARIRLASMRTVSVETSPANRHCCTTRTKTRRKTSSPQRWRMRVSEE